MMLTIKMTISTSITMSIFDSQFFSVSFLFFDFWFLFSTKKLSQNFSQLQKIDYMCYDGVLSFFGMKKLENQTENNFQLPKYFQSIESNVRWNTSKNTGRTDIDKIGSKSRLGPFYRMNELLLGSIRSTVNRTGDLVDMKIAEHLYNDTI